MKRGAGPVDDERVTDRHHRYPRYEDGYGPTDGAGTGWASRRADLKVDV
ncbi:hypothetical protein B005_3171 [Nocardiopsis alba ATCC BAA-2165]|uniref:Uncharacterized protein n=1 Tax=Nocardiopsis alba (strain ATCC BAA-2165 / BE74) TaxID=1205910 RepID=J7L6Q0_NOCAA|nr:hypothetical protein B005_3171 [Nocardiopsis alba ATCC BAA-2165]